MAELTSVSGNDVVLPEETPLDTETVQDLLREPETDPGEAADLSQEDTGEVSADPPAEDPVEILVEAPAEEIVTIEPVVYYDTVYAAVYDALAASETEETVTDGQMVNSTALSYFKGILGNQMLPVDYVVYTGTPYTYSYNGYDRTAYEYCMMYGDLSLEGITFTGEDVTVVRMRTSGNMSVNYETAASMSVAAPMYYSRSNLGAYSGIVEYDWDGVMLLVCAVMGGLIWFMGKIMCLKR